MRAGADVNPQTKKALKLCYAKALLGPAFGRLPLKLFAIAVGLIEPGGASTTAPNSPEVLRGTFHLSAPVRLSGHLGQPNGLSRSQAAAAACCWHQLLLLRRRQLLSRLPLQVRQGMQP